jgi:hypothetical protein
MTEEIYTMIVKERRELFKEGRIDGSKVRLIDGENEGMIVGFELGNKFW